jgi:hypothetical protein
LLVGALETENPLEIARGRLDAVAPLVTGNPETNTDLIGDQARREDPPDGFKQGHIEPLAVGPPNLSATCHRHWWNIGKRCP